MNLSALTQIQAAALLSVAPRTLRDWHDAPRNPDGTYPGSALVAYYVAKLGGSGEFDNQRERLAAAQAEKVEMENAVCRGRLADLDAVERVWADFVANARARLLGMGSKLGPQLVNIADASIVATAIRTEARAALNELADYTPGAGGSGAEGGQPVAPAAGTDGQPVGGPGAPAVKRKQRRARPVADG